MNNEVKSMIDFSTQCSSSKHRKMLGSILSIGLVLRLVLVIYVMPYPERYIQVDAIGYNQLAMNLLSGNGFSMKPAPPYSPNNFRTPIYPLTLTLVYTLFGYKPEVVLLLQAMMGTLTILLVYYIASMIVGIEAGLFAAVLAAVSPHPIIYTALLWSDTEYTLLLTLSIFLTIVMFAHLELRWVLVSSLCLGIATLVHPRSLYLQFLFVILLIATRLSKKLSIKQIMWHAVLYLLVFNLALLPWRIRNYISFGIPNLTSTSGINMLNYGAALAEATQTGESQWSIVERYKNRIREMSDAPLNEAEFANKAFQFALGKIIQSPWSYIKVHLIGTAKVFLPGTFAVNTLFTGQTAVNTAEVYSIFIVDSFSQTTLLESLSSFSALFWVYMAFAVLYLVVIYTLSLHSILSDFNFASWRWFLIGIVIYLAVVAGPAGSPRFQVALIPILCVLSAHSLLSLRRIRGEIFIWKKETTLRENNPPVYE
jgi:4-amino-4-deoxy-L-arabinose transferase-like glycosyltransferase